MLEQLQLFYVSLMVFRLKVLDAKALGDPGVLGTADISLADAQLQPNAGPRDMWLPLKVRKWASYQPSDVHFLPTLLHTFLPLCCFCCYMDRAERAQNVQ